MKFLFKQEVIDYVFINSKQENTILFLHGWGGNLNSFFKTIQLCKNRFNILSLSMPTILPTVNAWTLNDYSNLILQILKLHNIDEVHLVCHSFGFRVACLIKEKIKIKKIVVTGGAGLKQNSIMKKIENDNRKIHLTLNPNLFEKFASSDYKNLCETNKTTFKNIVNLNLKHLCKFKCPMLLFWGKHDIDTPLWIAKYLHKNNNAKLISTNSDHFAYIKEEARFNNEVLKFLL